MSVLCIFDASSLLYAGHKARAYKAKSDVVSDNPTVDGLPVGGLKYAVRYILTQIQNCYNVIVCFDSPTDRSKKYADYKGNRTADPAVYVQQLMLHDFVTDMGIPHLKVDNFEADDLIYSVMNKLRTRFSDHVIFSGDTDLAANIHDTHTELHGIASIYPTITASNFSAVVKGGEVVPFNAILPYYAIWGKASNNVAPLADKKTNTKLFDSYLAFTEQAKIQPGLRSTLLSFAQWLKHLLQTDEVDSKLIADLYNRIDAVFPRSYEISNDFSFKYFDDLDKDKLLFYLKCFGLDQLAFTYCGGLSLSSGRSAKMLKYLASYKDVYAQGALAVDAGMSPDESYFSDDITEFFVNGEDF